jgi:co-chaperonin GroES (HSP10)
MIVPFGYRTIHLVPFLGDGFTESGIEVTHHEKLQPIYGRVTAVDAECRDVRVNDFVVFRKYRPIELDHTNGKVWALNECHVLAVVRRADGSRWFGQADGN